jgi:hypothetical protein
MKIYIPVTWEVNGVVEVEAASVEEALMNFDPTAHDLPPESYVDGSFRLCTSDPEEVEMYLPVEKSNK